MRANEMERTALFSPCRRYRYTLWRHWGGRRGHAMFVGLNPSTADETQDDPTVRRCIGYARDWGYSGLCMTNIFAFRATDPAVMLAEPDPKGPDNDYWLAESARRAAIVVAAWGVHGVHRERHDTVRALLPSLHYLRLTKEGYPGHPLYLPKALAPTKWPRAGRPRLRSREADRRTTDHR